MTVLDEPIPEPDELRPCERCGALLELDHSDRAVLVDCDADAGCGRTYVHQTDRTLIPADTLAGGRLMREMLDEGTAWLIAERTAAGCSLEELAATQQVRLATTRTSLEMAGAPPETWTDLPTLDAVLDALDP